MVGRWDVGVRLKVGAFVSLPPVRVGETTKGRAVAYVERPLG